MTHEFLNTHAASILIRTKQLVKKNIIVVVSIFVTIFA